MVEYEEPKAGKDCKTAKGLLDRLDKIIFTKGSVFMTKCGHCDQTLTVSDWWVGHSLKEFITMNPFCEECGERFI